MKLAIALIFFFFSRLALAHGAATTTEVIFQHYIVYMGDHSYPNSESLILANHEMLASVMGSIDGAQQAIVHHYTKSFRGFSAMLTPEHAQQLAERRSVVSVFESKMNHAQTTHSWDFLGVDSIPQYNQLPLKSKSDVIIGVIDSGVWPESRSFDDTGLGPIPKRFKGKCVTGDNFTLANCNRKLIGTRFYYKGYEKENGPLESLNGDFLKSARDTEGHGSHTASTVAGSAVANVSFLGMATGTARGGAPSARLAIYKTLWFNMASDADLLKAFDDAISDGVDIISISIEFFPQRNFINDSISIGALHAFRKGILVSASAGNNGSPFTASNVAPWILTIAASSMDREFNANVYLGNTKILKGYSLSPLKMERSYGVIDANDAAAPGVSSKNASVCQENTLDPTLIKGKIVVCYNVASSLQSSIVVKQGGAVGMIVIGTSATYYIGLEIPSTLIGRKEEKELKSYLKKERDPIAKILSTMTVLNTRPAPKMAEFSSMGPNIITPDIIKPDITAPGVNILAAWTPLPVTVTKHVDYNIISGTSMSCPHVSAIAAIIKSCHPSWSPSAIKSAMMTTATVLDNTGRPFLKDPNGFPTTPFDYGSGHINPVAALNPGLIYDFDSNDIIDYLCGTGARPKQLEPLLGVPVTCKYPLIPAYNLNYPSIGIASLSGSMSVHRTVTYYGKGSTVYMANVEHPKGVKVVVKPRKLKFRNYGEKMSFKVDFIPQKNLNGSFMFVTGALTWENGIHKVRSPIALNFV
ncbi:hypothetical protein HHK36_018048 [Tetracentron sinense]|uniref:Uncharacterized protein n=1 Tax=Tetracentron sinense TaxID=13715 RepID=A0A834YV71_TETSI|nr:hypothetical protein HHK36_018048 [Tetracentron sinense]